MSTAASYRAGNVRVNQYEGEFLFCHKCGAETRRSERVVGYYGTGGGHITEVLRRCPNTPRFGNWLVGHTDTWTHPLLRYPVEADEV